MCYPSCVGAAEDAINAARDAFHAHLASLKKTQRETTDFTDEELVMEEKDVDQEFSGTETVNHSVGDVEHTYFRDLCI